MNYDVIVIGSGPGGYVAAIRASQLGMKTAVVEKAELGGICLNWGCIPTKALLKSAQVYEYLLHAQDYGLKAKEVEVDFPSVVKRSRGVADKMSKGVQFLMKKNKVDVIVGTGKVKPGKKVDVTGADGKVVTYDAKHIILATGPVHVSCRILNRTAKKLLDTAKPWSSTKCLKAWSSSDPAPSAWSSLISITPWERKLPSLNFFPV